MNSSVKATMRPTKAPKRGRPHRATIEAHNGGGYTTRIHHMTPDGSEYGPGPAPIEAAHKTESAAVKHLKDNFFAKQGVQGADNPSAGPGGMGNPEPIES